MSPGRARVQPTCYRTAGPPSVTHRARGGRAVHRRHGPSVPRVATATHPQDMRTPPPLTAVAVALLLCGAAGAPRPAAPSTEPTGPTEPTEPAGTARTAYAAPADGAALRLFDPPAVPWGRGHRGVDLGADGPVRSPGAGVVTFAGPVAGRGVVTVTHPDGLRSSLEPVIDAPEVGTAVARGDPLGSVQPGHCAVRCVHWGVRRGDTYVDPLSLLGDVTVVLLG